MGGCAFGLGGLAHFELGDELAEILIAGAGVAEEGETCWGQFFFEKLWTGEPGGWCEARDDSEPRAEMEISAPTWARMLLRSPEVCMRAEP